MSTLALWRDCIVFRLCVMSFIVLVVFGLTNDAHAVIEQGISVGIRDFAVLPDSSGGNSAPARVNVVTSDPLGRLFVNDQRGPLYTMSSDGSTVTNYLDLSTFAGINLVTSSEQGFQGFSFHPDFAETGTDGFGKFYTIHSEGNTGPAPNFPFVSNTGSSSNNTHDTLLLEWSVTDPTAATYAAGGGGAPREVLRLEQPRGNHNSGQIAFNTSVGSGDTDYGNLYVAIGDGGSGNDPWNIARDPNKPYGKMFRIDPLDPDGAGGADYGIASENVFASDGDSSTLAEVYAYGLRNPQRFGWDDTTGNLYVADIGQGAWEEINLLSNGGHFGWDVEEGNSNPLDPSLEDPIAKYNRSGDIPLPPVPGLTGGRAITAGEVVRGTGIPGLDGLLLAGDFPTGAPLYIDVSGGPPAQRSGVDPFAELILVDVDGSGLPIDFLTEINNTRAANGLSTETRADLRWSYGIEGRVFLSNKKDGVIRELIHLLPGDFDFDGDVDGLDFLEWQQGDRPVPLSSTDLEDWEDNYGNFLSSANAAVVPEPSAISLSLLLALSALCSRNKSNVLV